MKNDDGSLYLGKVGPESIMFWCFADEVDEDSLEMSAYWMKKVANEYIHLDHTLS